MDLLLGFSGNFDKNYKKTSSNPLITKSTTILTFLSDAVSIL